MVTRKKLLIVASIITCIAILTGLVLIPSRYIRTTTVKAATKEPITVINVQLDKIGPTRQLTYATPLQSFEYVSEQKQKQTFEAGPEFVPAKRNITAETIVEKMGVKNGDSLADIGSGEGHFVFPLSDAVGATGKIFSVEINQACLLYQMQLQREMIKDHSDKFHNIVFKLDTDQDLMLPDNCLDHAIFVGVHNYFFADKESIIKYQKQFPTLSEDEIENKIIFDSQKEFTTTLKRSLKPGAKLGLIEPIVNNRDDSHLPYITIKKNQVIQLMTEQLGFTYVNYVEFPDYGFYIFENVK